MGSAVEHAGVADQPFHLGDPLGGLFGRDALDLGDIGVYAGTQPGQGPEELQAVETALDEILQNVIDNGVSADEVADAKNSLISSVVYLKDNQMSREAAAAIDTKTEARCRRFAAQHRSHFHDLRAHARS